MADATPTDAADIAAPPEAGSVLIRGLTLLGFAVALLMLALGAAMLWSAREEVRREAELSSNNLSIALERDIARNIASLDLSVQGAIDALSLPGMADVSPAIRHTALFDRAATAEYLGSILVVDRTGQTIAASTDDDISHLRLEDRDYFQVHRDRADVGAYLSLPFRSRLRNGDPSVAVSRRVTAADGSFGGVVMGSLRLAFFQRLFDTLNLGPKGVVTLTRMDGVLLARRPAAADDTGRNVSRSEVFARFKAAASGHFIDRSTIDGVERLYAFRRIADLPLVLVVGLAVEDIYAGWWRKAIVIGSVLFALSVATATLCLLFRYEMFRRLAAQRALLEAAERLRVMASTDSLTGLPNRRTFEEALALEWQRATRQKSELALLMMDADFFKPYNDLYGHPAGDRALQRLADAIRASALRPTDLAARIGGEEFVALLPATGLGGAQILAERIRQAVHDLAIAHSGSAYGRMTFSIGIASMTPDHEAAPAMLLKRADDAMYQAKTAGRNRVVVAGAAPATENRITPGS